MDRRIRSSKKIPTRYWRNGAKNEQNEPEEKRRMWPILVLLTILIFEEEEKKSETICSLFGPTWFFFFSYFFSFCRFLFLLPFLLLRCGVYGESRYTYSGLCIYMYKKRWSPRHRRLYLETVHCALVIMLMTLGSQDVRKGYHYLVMANCIRMRRGFSIYPTTWHVHVRVSILVVCSNHLFLCTSRIYIIILLQTVGQSLTFILDVKYSMDDSE